MPRAEKRLVSYFLFFFVLSLIAVIPGGTVTVLLITGMALPLFGLPGFLVAASPTILLYSLALLPPYLMAATPRYRIWSLAALLVPAAVAIGPSLFSQSELRAFAARMSKNDMRSPAPAKPRSIELNGDGRSGVFIPAESFGDKNASCDAICRRLLFNGEVDWVRMVRTPDIYSGRRQGAVRSVTYRLDRRQSCPQIYETGTPIEKAVRDRLVAGDCIIAEPETNTAAEAVVTFLTRYADSQYPRQPPAEAPSLATIRTVKDLRIESAQSGALMPIVQQTETAADALPLPFYIGAEMNMQGGRNGATIGHNRTTIHPVDLAQVLRETFGFQLAEISPPPAEQAGQIAERILALPPQANSPFSAQQQEILKDELNATVRQDVLSDADIDFVRRIIADSRITAAEVGIVLQAIFRKHDARLRLLIPVVLDRISTPVAERVGHYQSSLGWTLTNFAADDLRPYRDKMVAVAEAHTDWPGAGVLTRLAELGGEDALALVVRRLDSQRLAKFAAIAVCRAPVETWAALEPAVMAHLASPKRSGRLEDSEEILLRALVRNSKKPMAGEIIEKRQLPDANRLLARFAKFQPGFSPDRCREFML